MQFRMLLAFSLSLVAARLPLSAYMDPHALTLTYLISWNHIQTPIVSSDGGWLAYKLTPNDGDAEVVLKNLKDGKESRFSIGQIVRPNPYTSGDGPPPAAGLPHDLVFSDDSQWIAFDVHPTAAESKTLKKQHKPLHDKVILVEVATNKKSEFQGIKSFSFAGEKSSAIALLRYPANDAPGPATPSAGAKKEDKPQGSDLILLELASGKQLSIGNVSEYAFDKPGEWLAWIVDAQDKLGNGLELRNISNGQVTALDSAEHLINP